MKVSIVTVVIKVIEYVKKKNNNDNMLSKFDIKCLGEWNGQRSAGSVKREASYKVSTIES